MQSKGCDYEKRRWSWVPLIELVAQYRWSWHIPKKTTHEPKSKVQEINCCEEAELNNLHQQILKTQKPQIGLQGTPISCTTGKKLKERQKEWWITDKATKGFEIHTNTSAWDRTSFVSTWRVESLPKSRELQWITFIFVSFLPPGSCWRSLQTLLISS